MGEILAPKAMKNSQHGFKKNVAETPQTVWFGRRKAPRRESKAYFSVLATRLHKGIFLKLYGLLITVSESITR